MANDKETNQPINEADIPATKMAADMKTILEERKAEDVSLIPITERSSLADYFILGTVQSTPQGRSISEHLIEEIEEQYGRKPIRTEGLDTVRWILLDYGDVVVHLFHPEERAYYSLDKLWAHEEPAPASTDSDEDED